MSNTTSFSTLDRALLLGVAGGAARVTARSSGSSEEIKTMLAGVTDGIKGLANQKSSGMDPTMMMMMMMMGGGGGGSGGAAPVAAAPPPPPAKPIVNITNSVSR